MLWEEVPLINQNGLIVNYEVRYIPLMTFEGQISTATVNTTYLNTILTGLQEYVEYNISVRAYTSEGPGPYSDPVTERTLEDGRCFLAEQMFRSTFSHRACCSPSECSHYDSFIH